MGVCSIPGGLPAWGGGFLQPPWGRGHELEKPGGNRDTNHKGQVIRGVAWTVSPYFTLPITSPAFSSPGLFYFLYCKKGSSLRDWFSLGASRLLVPGRGLRGCSSACPGLWGAMSTSDGTQESHCEAAWHQSFGGVTVLATLVYLHFLPVSKLHLPAHELKC